MVSAQKIDFHSRCPYYTHEKSHGQFLSTLYIHDLLEVFPK